MLSWDKNISFIHEKSKIPVILYYAHITTISISNITSSSCSQTNIEDYFVECVHSILFPVFWIYRETCRKKSNDWNYGSIQTQIFSKNKTKIWVFSFSFYVVAGTLLWKLKDELQERAFQNWLSQDLTT